MFSDGKIVPVNIREEMKRSYIDYAMSVIVGRALPDVRDGLKPVHRRILFAMNELGMTPDKPFRKCARIVGEVLGKYHPHGDSSVYEALVRMAQDFSTRYLTVDGHGNFGSVDGDSAAAMRYTEARMHKITQSMLADIDCDTVDFMPNFDGSLQEPTVLPVRLPMLLLNGTSGIAVGMATNVPPHNVCEVVDGLVAMIDNPDITVSELMQYIKGPDFPTAATIVGLNDIKQAYETGRGSIKMQAVSSFEEISGGAGRQSRTAIVVTEIPYQVNKSDLILKIADLVKEQRITGISDIRDESDREGMRIVIELKRDAKPDVVKNNLYKYTQLATTFGVNLLALCDQQPRLLNLQQVLSEFSISLHSLDAETVGIVFDESYEQIVEVAEVSFWSDYGIVMWWLVDPVLSYSAVQVPRCYSEFLVCSLVIYSPVDVFCSVVDGKHRVNENPVVHNDRYVEEVGYVVDELLVCAVDDKSDGLCQRLVVGRHDIVGVGIFDLNSQPSVLVVVKFMILPHERDVGGIFALP